MPSRGGQFDGPMEPTKEFAPDIFLKSTDVSADGGLRHVQFARCLCETETARGGFKSSQRKQ